MNVSHFDQFLLFVCPFSGQKLFFIFENFSSLADPKNVFGRALSGDNDAFEREGEADCLSMR
jgi:hypothetical protein